VLPVEVLPAPGGNLILRARGSELLIITNHVVELKTKREPKQFTEYFMGEALINRPARKLFEAWLRKDRGLWRRIYDCVQTIDTSGDDIAALKEEMKAKSAQVKAEPKAEAAPKPKAEVKVEAKAAKEAEDSGKAKSAKKPAKKAAAPEKEKTPAKKAETKSAKPAAKSTKEAAKPAAKKAAEKKAPAAKKPAAKAAAKPKAKKK